MSGAARGGSGSYLVMIRPMGGHTGRGSGWTGGYRETVIHFGMYNIIRIRRNGGLKSELWGGGSGQPWPGCIPIYQVESVGKRWFIVGCYLAPNNTATTNIVVMAIGQNPCRSALLVAGYFNTYLAAKEGNSCRLEIVAAIATAGIEYISSHFLPH